MPRPCCASARRLSARQPNYTWLADSAAPRSAASASSPTRSAATSSWPGPSARPPTRNTVTLCRDGGLIGNGVGQQDRVGCCELALKRAADAGHEAAGAVAASDSFFPRSDGPETLIDAGVVAIWATSGSVRDRDTQELRRGRGVASGRCPTRCAGASSGTERPGGPAGGVRPRPPARRPQAHCHPGLLARPVPLCFD